MSESEDKAKKLKEIQERLAEIKGTSANSVTKKIVAKESSPSEKQVTSSSSPQKAPISAPSKKKESIKPTSSKPIERDKIASNKAKSQEELHWRENRKKDTKLNKSRSGNKLSKIYTAISLIITLSICSYFIFTFFLKPNNESQITSKIPEEIVVNSAEAAGSNSLNLESNKKSSDKLVEKANKSAQSETLVQEIASESDHSKSSDVVKKEAKPLVADVVTSNQPKKVQSKIPEGVIISYASNSTEEMAKKNTSMLSNKGFQASYYYMPDKNSSSPELYKVYVGPYSNESDAMDDFRKVVKLNEKAFIVRAN